MYSEVAHSASAILLLAPRWCADVTFVEAVRFVQVFWPVEEGASPGPDSAVWRRDAGCHRCCAEHVAEQHQTTAEPHDRCEREPERDADRRPLRRQVRAVCRGRVSALQGGAATGSGREP